MPSSPDRDPTEASNANRDAKLPVAFRVWGMIAAPGAVWLVLRLVWEQTFLTWENGPQMVGFSLAHSNIVLSLVGSLLLLLGWFLSVLVRSIWVTCRGHRPRLHTWCALTLTALLFGILCVPYGSWQRLGADAMAKRSDAGEFLTFAAATGDLATVKSLLNRGVSINAVNSEGSTAIYGAAVEGQLTIIEHLLAHGADPNIPNQYGHTALAAAREMHRSNAERYLLSHGAK